MDPRSSLKRYQIVIEKVIQIKSKGKKSLGFGKNDLNMMSYTDLAGYKCFGGFVLLMKVHT
jgi:hypothetical protein